MELKNKNRLLARIGQGRVNPEVIAQIKTTLTEFQGNQRKRNFLNAQMEKMKKLIEDCKNFDGRLAVKGCVHQGTVIKILNGELEIKKSVDKKSFVLKEGEIIVNNL